MMPMSSAASNVSLKTMIAELNMGYSAMICDTHVDRGREIEQSRTVVD